MVFLRKNAYIICILFFAAAVVLLGAATIKTPADPKVVINEICTSNVISVKDENGEYPDWIELYNKSEAVVDISGYIINKPADRNNGKYVIPDGTALEPGALFVCDPGFKMSSDGCRIELLDLNGECTDSVDVPPLSHDTTYARSTDGADEWVIKQPTPGYENAEREDLAETIRGEIRASKKPGFYSEEFDLKLRSSMWGRTIYYTTDGRDPVKFGTVYDQPIRIYDRSKDENIYSAILDVSPEYTEGQESPQLSPVDKCTTVRAVEKDLLGRYTPVETFTYFIGFDDRKAYANMPVVSISADPDDLFAYESGRMVLGEKYDRFADAGYPEEYDDDKANFLQTGRQTERDISLCVFDENHTPVLETKAGIRVKGMSSRWDVQKSFNVVFHNAYGGNYKEIFMLDGKILNTHSFSLDKCGQDPETKMRDTLMHYCMKDSTCATTNRIPCCVFLNGEYWGFYWLGERYDQSFFADKYGALKDSVVIENTDELETYDEWMYSVDRKSLIDYFAANIITAHEGDWPHMNLTIWKTSEDEGTPFCDGKYRPVILDMNSDSMIDPGSDSPEYLVERYYPFREMSRDEAFRKELVARIDSMCKNEFEQNAILKRIDEMYLRIRDQMILDRMRYYGKSAEEAEAFFDENVEILRNFYRNRYDNLNSFINEYINMEIKAEEDL